MNTKQVYCILFAQESQFKLRRAIDNFLAQSYEQKVLLVICKHYMDEQCSLIESYNADNLKVVKRDSNSSSSKKDFLFKLISKLNCQYICLWSCDEWSHSNRIQYQLDALEHTQKSISTLLYSFIYNSDNQAGFALPPLVHLDTALIDLKALFHSGQRCLEQLFNKQISGELLLNIAPTDQAFLLVKIYGVLGRPVDEFYTVTVRESEILTTMHTETLEKAAKCIGEGNKALSVYFSSLEFAGSAIYGSPPFPESVSLVSFYTDILFEHKTSVESRTMKAGLGDIEKLKIWRCKTEDFLGVYMQDGPYSLFGYDAYSTNSAHGITEKKSVIGAIQRTLNKLGETHNIQQLSNINELCFHALKCFESAAEIISNCASIIKVNEKHSISHLHSAEQIDIKQLKNHLMMLDHCKIWYISTELCCGLYAEHNGLCFLAFSPKPQGGPVASDRLGSSIDLKLRQDLVEFGTQNHIYNLMQISPETINDLTVLYEAVISETKKREAAQMKEG